MKKIKALFVVMLLLAGCQSAVSTPYTLNVNEESNQYEYTISGDEETYTLSIPTIDTNQEEVQEVTGPIYSLNPRVTNESGRGLTNSTFYKNDDVDTNTKDRVYNYAQYGYGFWVLNDAGQQKAQSNAQLSESDYEVVYGDFYHDSNINNEDYIKYYIATQELIWETIVNPDTDAPYQIEFVDIDTAEVKEEILSTQQEYSKTPFFNGSIMNISNERLSQGEPFELEDQHNVLNRFEIQASENIELLESEESNKLRFNISEVDRNTRISFIPQFKIDKEFSEVFSSQDNVSYLSIGQERALSMASNLFIESTSQTNTINLVISTYDIDTKTEIFGSQYHVSTGPEFLSPVETTVSEEGYPALAENLAPGTYYVQQIVAPEGYVLNQEVETITIGGGIQETVHPFYNIKQ